MENIMRCTPPEELIDRLREFALPLISSEEPVISQEANAAAMPKGPHLPMLSHFPALKGPFAVGSIDLEMASGPFAMDDDKDPQMFFEKPSTILFRMFYPTAAPTNKPMYWVPEPYQSDYLHAYEKFSGTGGLRNFLLGLFPRQVLNIKVHATEAAAPADIEPRSPVIIISHSLGGSRHSYTYIATYLASHGCYVICPEHRDGSAALSLVRDKLANPTNDKEGWINWEPTPSRVEYTPFEDTFTKSVETGRLKQMAIRCWELQILFRALCKINTGDELREEEMHVGCEMQSMPPLFLQGFKGRMNSLVTPGEVIWLGHGYGAATIIQLHKSTYYPVPPSLTDKSTVIFARPPKTCPLRNQVTTQSALILLDPWVFPLAFKQVRYLFRLRLPQLNAAKRTPRSLCIMSDQFYAWKEAMLCLRRVLNRNPMMCPLPLKKHTNQPFWFVVEESGHGNQSDFGLLFNHHPGITIDEPKDPKFIIDANCKCILEYLKHELKLWEIPIGDTEIVGNLLEADDSDRPWRWKEIRASDWDRPEWNEAQWSENPQNVGIEDSWFCNFMVSDKEHAQFLLPNHIEHNEEHQEGEEEERRRPREDRRRHHNEKEPKPPTDDGAGKTRKQKSDLKERKSDGAVKPLRGMSELPLFYNGEPAEELGAPEAPPLPEPEEPLPPKGLPGSSFSDSRKKEPASKPGPKEPVKPTGLKLSFTSRTPKEPTKDEPKLSEPAKIQMSFEPEVTKPVEGSNSPKASKTSTPIKPSKPEKPADSKRSSGSTESSVPARTIEPKNSTESTKRPESKSPTHPKEPSASPRPSETDIPTEPRNPSALSQRFELSDKPATPSTPPHNPRMPGGLPGLQTPTDEESVKKWPGSQQRAPSAARPRPARINTNFGHSTSLRRSMPIAQSSNVTVNAVTESDRPSVPDSSRYSSAGGGRSFRNLWGLFDRANPPAPPPTPRTEADIVAEVGLSPFSRAVRRKTSSSTLPNNANADRVARPQE